MTHFSLVTRLPDVVTRGAALGEDVLTIHEDLGESASACRDSDEELTFRLLGNHTANVLLLA